MKFIYIILIAGVLVSGLYLYMQVQRHVDKSISKTEMQYMACIERGGDPQSCAVEQLMLRGLVCKS